MRKIPKSWEVIDDEDPEWIEYRTPISTKEVAVVESGIKPQWLEREGQISTRLRRGRATKNYKRQGIWYRIHRVRRPGYTKPPGYTLIYGLWTTDLRGGCVLCRFPGGLPWRKTVFPALNRVASSYGHSFYSKDPDKKALVEGGDADMWGSKTMVKYDWDGTKFELVS